MLVGYLFPYVLQFLNCAGKGDWDKGSMESCRARPRVARPWFLLTRESPIGHAPFDRLVPCVTRIGWRDVTLGQIELEIQSLVTCNMATTYSGPMNLLVNVHPLPTGKVIGWVF